MDMPSGLIWLKFEGECPFTSLSPTVHMDETALRKEPLTDCLLRLLRSTHGSSNI
jgi:hypothetical protein